MYNPSDIYVSGGPDDLLVCWTDKVSKFDSSGFYNWEQDNLAIHDLEERTHLLWEKFGHPTSALTGMSFVVSADATSSCSPTFFTTLSGCVDALPEVINCPILVEVASFGDLGGLQLGTKGFGPNGSLEIVNRLFGHGGGKDHGNKTINIVEDDATTTYGYMASSYAGDGPNYSIDVDVLGSPANDFLATTPNSDFINATLYSTGEVVASALGYDDMRFSSTPVSVFTRNMEAKNNRMTASVKSTGTYGGKLIPWQPSQLHGRKAIEFEPFDINASNRVAESMDSYDVSTLNEIDNTSVLWGEPAVTPRVQGVGNTHYGAACLMYANTLDFIDITNCNGPVYIRNFHVDGGAAHSTQDGISVNNSNVFLENCAATRCGNAGLNAVNSYVTLLRGFVAFRCYAFDADGNRVGVAYDDKRTLESTRQESFGAGIKAFNSTIEFGNSFNRDYVQSNAAFNHEPRAQEWAGYLVDEPSPVGSSPTPNSTNLFCISRNDIGIEANNSVLIGGRTEVSGLSATVSNLWMDSSQLFLEANSEAGLKSFNSTISYKGRLNLYGNHRGLDAINSDISVDVLKAQYNQREGIKLLGSNLTYGSESYPGFLHTSQGNAYATTRSTYKFDQVTLEENGKHIYAKNSVIKPLMVSSMPEIYQGFFVSGSIGTDFGKTANKVSPAIHLDNSHADLIHPTILRQNVVGSTEASYGDALLADNNSTAILRGSGRYATRIVGPNSVTSQARKAGLAAVNNSNIRLQGPTAIGGFAVDALADKNSVINFEPHRNENGSLLVSAFDLESRANHTMVELHSTRSCLVADKGSVIDMEDLGSYHDYWSNGTYGAAIPSTFYDYLKEGETGSIEYAGYVSGGYLQFYANTILGEADPNFTVTNEKFIEAAGHPAGLENGDNASGYLYAFPDTPNALAISAITTGGMCVRALNQSNVNVNNVHFPTGWPNPSGAFYDYDGLHGACDRLHIWNIADTSQLNAKYVTVSGVHPRDAGYHGPSGTWGTSSAPEASPDTSALSVLDYYGRDADDQNKFGQDDFRNFGPFRLYFSVDPVTNYLVDPVQVVSGVPYQIFSQGYNWSGSLSAPGTVSAFYTSLLEEDADGIPMPSSFYYASSMLHSPGTVKAILDDSGSNTFANAKHNTVGKSGCSKIVHIYDAYDGARFGGDSTTTKTEGNGLGSVNNFDLKKDN